MQAIVDLLKNGAYLQFMNIAYLMNRPVKEGDAMGCDRVFADWKGTNRAELIALLSVDEETGKGHFIQEGVTVRVRAISDLGQGAESARIREKISELGGTVEEMRVKGAVKQTGRQSDVQFKTLEDWEHGCSLWYSPAPEDHARQRISDIVGGDVDRNWCNYQCGNRKGSQKEAKRQVMLKRLGLD